MKGLFLIFVVTVVCAPVVFLVYLEYDLVCAPRAILSSVLFGIIPLFFLTFAVFKKKTNFYYVSLFILIIEIMITPVIMITRLGWEKLVNERMLAFFTFEGVALVQFLIVVLLLKYFKKLHSAEI